MNSTTPGFVNQEDYDFWISRFGATSGSDSIAAVPEPTGLLLVLAGLSAIGLGRIRIVAITLRVMSRNLNRHHVQTELNGTFGRLSVRASSRGA